MIVSAGGILIIIGLMSAWRMAQLDAARQSTETARAVDYQLLLGVMEASGDPIFVKDLAGCYVIANPATLDVLGLGLGEVIGRCDAELLDSQIAEGLSVADRQVFANGQTLIFEEILPGKTDVRTFLSTKSPLRSAEGQIIGLVGVSHEITERKQREAEIAHQATHDPLTGLANRTLFVDRLSQALCHAERLGHRVAVIDLDVDAFRIVNEELSFRVGDALLQAVAQRISDNIRSGDTVSRVYGDEFLVILSQAGDDDWTEGAVRRIEQAISAPWQYEGREIDIAASAGISIYPDNGSTVNELIRHAEAAMHRAKDLGKNRLEFSNNTPAVIVSQRLDEQRALRNAIERGEFALYLQPKVALQSGLIVGAETLIRWNHPEYGLVAPGMFIPLAEQCGLISPIGDWVMHEACRIMAQWQAAGVAAVPLAVNLSAQQLHDARLPQRFADVMSAAGVSPQFIDFEVTETTLLRDRECARKALYALREAGSHLALDDFGTGYSSLTFLRDFPVSTLKLDRSFVMDVNSDINAATIARTVIGMARSLQMRVVAEGVETAAQLRFLDRYRCDEMQGYLFSKPLPEAEFHHLLATGQQLDLAGHGVERIRTLLILDDEPAMLSALRRTFRRDGYRLLLAANADEAMALMASNNVQVILAEQRLKGLSGLEFLAQVKTAYPETIRIILSGYTELSTVVNSVNQGAIYKFLTKPWEDEDLREQIRDAFLQHEAKFAVS
jgi:diguanylate cyclase (GGDEF)-like protein/PAS domain S-box-containing protein